MCFSEAEAEAEAEAKANDGSQFVGDAARATRVMQCSKYE